ncbi:MAG: GlxA family transcriptional regulator [Formosimonas sp.]
MLTKVDTTTPAPVTTLGFLLLKDFSMIAFANAVETFRMANYISQRELYRWQVVSLDNNTCASNGVAVHQSQQLNLEECDIVFVCGGVNIHQAIAPATLKLIRQLANKKITLGSLCTGAIALASAGVLDGYRCAIHWEYIAAANESYPKVKFTDSIYVLDRDRYTSSGGIASLDMVLQLIHHQHGRQLAASISEQFILDRIRGVESTQHLPRPEGIGPGYEHVAEAIELMQANIEEVLPLHEIAQLVNISLRQIERLFNHYFDMSPAQYYLRLRLRRARELLSQTSMPIMQVTVACGFTTSSHFCKTFRNFFGYSPRDQRKQQFHHPTEMILPLKH